MAKTATQFNNIAIKRAQLMFRDSNGYPMGQETDPDDVVQGTVTGAYVIDGLIDLTPGEASFPVVTNQGGQRIISKTRVAATDYGQPGFQLSQRDETLEAYLTRTAVDVATNTTRAIRSSGLSQNVWSPFMVLFSLMVTNSQTGMPEWDHWAYLNTIITRSQDAAAAQVTGDATNPNPLGYTLDLALASRDITGLPLSSLAINAQDDLDALVPFRSDNPVAVATFVADAAATTFTLPYLPLSDDATGAGANNITKNGVTQTATSVATDTGIVTIPSATAGDIYVVVYETDFEPSP